MKIIKFDPKSSYAELMYYRMNKILEFGWKYLPFIFLKKVYLDGRQLELPRWITKKQMDEIDKRTQDLMNNLNWE